MFKVHGKLSYNNLLDVDAADKSDQRIQNDGPTFTILKHNNACGWRQELQSAKHTMWR
jgi:phosphoribosylaminoimidazolecarboxamide formyltransferase/IMP cyclohydrolase